jgi:hypothetical protein
VKEKEELKNFNVEKRAHELFYVYDSDTPIEDDTHDPEDILEEIEIEA